MIYYGNNSVDTFSGALDQICQVPVITSLLQEYASNNTDPRRQIESEIYKLFTSQGSLGEYYNYINRLPHNVFPSEAIRMVSDQINACQIASDHLKNAYAAGLYEIHEKFRENVKIDPIIQNELGNIFFSRGNLTHHNQTRIAIHANPSSIPYILQTFFQFCQTNTIEFRLKIPRNFERACIQTDNIIFYSNSTRNNINNNPCLMSMLTCYKNNISGYQQNRPIDYQDQLIFWPGIPGSMMPADSLSIGWGEEVPSNAPAGANSYSSYRARAIRKALTDDKRFSQAWVSLTIDQRKQEIARALRNQAPLLINVDAPHINP